MNPALYVVGFVDPRALPPGFFNDVSRPINPHWETYGLGDEYGHTVADGYEQAPYKIVDGGKLGLDNNYGYAVYQDGHVEMVFTVPDTGSYWLEGNLVSREPTRRTTSELIALGFDPSRAARDSHGYYVPGVIAGMDWQPTPWVRPDGLFIDTLLFDLGPGLIFSALTAGFAAIVAVPAALATEGAIIAESAPVIVAESAPIIVAESAPIIAESAPLALDAETLDAIGAGWESSAATSSVQNVALAEAAGMVEAGTLAATIGEEAAAAELADAAVILEDAPVFQAQDVAKTPTQYAKLASQTVAALTKLAQQKMAEKTATARQPARASQTTPGSPTLPSPANGRSLASYLPAALVLLAAAIPLKG